jgi:hypothetical protein
MNTYPWGWPPPYYPPPPAPPNPMSCTPKEFKQWLKIVDQWKKDADNNKDKKKDEKPKAKTFSTIEVFLVLLAASPFIALLYKSIIIPALLR